ncbi:MAG: cyclase [Thermoplasmata archaeon]
MTAVIVRHKVKDFAKWRVLFDSLDAFHKANGVKNAQILGGTDDPNEVVVITEFEDAAKAHRFAQLEELRKAMEQSGVIGIPEVLFLEHAGHRSFV